MKKSTNLKTWLVVSVFLLGLSGSVWATGTYEDGDGSEGDPFQINTPAQMDEIGRHSEDWGSYFILTADIDLSAYTGTAFNIIGNSGTKFTGSFDGDGHTISNFTYTSAGINFIGLFGYVSGGMVKDLCLTNVNVDAGTGVYVGGLVGNNYGTVSNCYATVSVTGDYRVGGLVGANNGIISNCYATGNVSGPGDVGGLVGMNWGTVSNCYSTGDVNGNGLVGGLVGDNSGPLSNCYATGDVSGNSNVGGLVGRNYDGTVSNCYAAGNVAGTGNRVGGLVGTNVEGTVSNCYAAGSVTGDDLVGGLVGKNYYYATVSNSYTTGDVTGVDKVGGLVGDNWYYATVSNCYAAGSVTGDGRVGGLVAANSHGTVIRSFWDIDTSGMTYSDGGIGKTTAEMQTKSTFTNAGWDFYTPIWEMCENTNDYPHLWWEYHCNNAPLDIDIKPGSCPNPLNVKSRGMVSVAILGTEEFDVSTIDVASIFLNGVPAIRSSYEDVGGPVANPNECECTTEAGDGFGDLILKFVIRDVLETLGEVNTGDILTLTLTGVLNDETGIEGTDCVVIVGRHKPINEADINKDGVVNTVDIAIVAENWLESSIVEE